MEEMLLSGDELREKAKELRKMLLTMIYKAQSGHPGGSLSATDIVASLYFHTLRVDPKNPKWEDRDRFVLSKGHVCPVLYSALIMRGFISEDTIGTLRKQGSILQGHPDMKRCPGIEISTGSWDRASPVRSEWQSQEKWMKRSIVFTPCSATASAMRARYGRQRRRQTNISWIT